MLLQSNKEYLSIKITEEKDDRTSANRGQHAGDSEVSESSNEELALCRRELENMKALHEAVVESLAECQKNYTLLRDSVSEKERMLESLGTEKSTLFEKVEQLKLKVMEQDVKMSAVEQEKAVLQVTILSGCLCSFVLLKVCWKLFYYFCIIIS